MTIAAEPDSLQGAVASGILGCGSVILGSSTECAKLLEEIVISAENGDVTASAKNKAREIKDADAKIPGFGHTLHKPNDPRAVRLLNIADDLGVSGQYVGTLRALAAVVDEIWAKHVVLNIQGPIAAIALDMGMSSFMAKSIPLLARTASVIGHINEELDAPLALKAYLDAAGAVKYVNSDD
jgi:citrate synthase